MAESSSITVPLNDTPSESPKTPAILGSASNLANLLPSGTLIVFQTLYPSFTGSGVCYPSNQYLTGFLIGICSLSCWFFSFTDSFIGLDENVYYGVATCKGLYIFNFDYKKENQTDIGLDKLSTFRLRRLDFVHAFFTFLVFLSLAFRELEVQNCFFPGLGENIQQLVSNLPLGIGVFSSFLFILFPTTRKGIGYSDAAPSRLE